MWMCLHFTVVWELFVCLALHIFLCLFINAYLCIGYHQRPSMWTIFRRQSRAMLQLPLLLYGNTGCWNIILRNIYIYMFDEPSSYLDGKQRLKAAKIVRSLLRPNRYLFINLISLTFFFFYFFFVWPCNGRWVFETILLFCSFMCFSYVTVVEHDLSILDWPHFTTKAWIHQG